MTLVLKRLNVDSKTPKKLSQVDSSTENDLNSSVASSGESNENLPLASSQSFISDRRQNRALSHSSVSSSEGDSLYQSHRSQRSVSSAGSSSVDENTSQPTGGLAECLSVTSEPYICKKTGVQLRKPKITNV